MPMVFDNQTRKTSDKQRVHGVCLSHTHTEVGAFNHIAPLIPVPPSRSGVAEGGWKGPARPSHVTVVEGISPRDFGTQTERMKKKETERTNGGK